jgi:hypothetical protein
MGRKYILMCTPLNITGERTYIYIYIYIYIYKSSASLLLREECPVPIELETLWAQESLGVLEKPLDPLTCAPVLWSLYRLRFEMLTSAQNWRIIYVLGTWDSRISCVSDYLLTWEENPYSMELVVSLNCIIAVVMKYRRRLVYFV